MMVMLIIVIGLIVLLCTPMDVSSKQEIFY